MTHTIHRYGKVEDLENDYTIIYMTARGYNKAGSEPKIRKFLDLCVKHHAVNFGNMEAGSMVVMGVDRVMETVREGMTVQACFANQEDITNILAELVELDLGQSVVVQGLIHRVEECCQRTGLKPHTWNHSLGIWGKTELLPEPEVLEVTTMCGHGLISVQLVRKVFEDIRSGRTTMKKATEKISRPCLCGLVNPVRMEAILTRIKEKQEELAAATASD